MAEKNLVIVESPAKAKTIENFLGKDFKVLSSYGHIRDLKKKDFSIDTDTFTPEYEIPEDKVKLVNELRKQASKAETVWLASDEDREGEAIAWHLYEVLGLTPEKTKRIVFHEITKNAIQEAIKHPRNINEALVNAQQARRVLDRIVGFKLSPILWRKVKPSLSAGRVQSVTVRLLVEREREINTFESVAEFRLTAIFETTTAEGQTARLKAKLNKTFGTEAQAQAFLEACRTASFVVDDVTMRPQKRTPAPPFTTSTLQQEAVRKLGYSVSQTMMLAQRLYESGHITYMRTDSVNLSSLALNTCEATIAQLMGEGYAKRRNYQTKAKGAQEAHEAIRPTDISRQKIEATAQEQRLYSLIWKRTIASQMADALLEKTTINIAIGHQEEKFVATGEVVKFDGFLRVYRESHEAEEEETNLLPAVTQGQRLTAKEVVATERFSQHPPRYTEAGLVHKLEELGIGRPSTYAPTISVIQQRNYAIKGDKTGTPRQYTVLTLADNNISVNHKTEMEGAEKNKLIPTDVGIVVNDFLTEYFPEILDYNFTAKVEQQFDEVAEGGLNWIGMMKEFYDGFEPQVEKTLTTKSDRRVGERELGIDPKSGRPVFVKIGRFGPVVQIGAASEDEKPAFASLPAHLGMETVTLDEALELFKLPRTLGSFEDSPVVANTGRFGPYVMHQKKYVSIPKDADPMTITLDEAVALITQKRETEANRLIKTFGHEPTIELLNGRYGPYISCDGKNYKLPKDKHETAATLTLDDCLAIIKEQQDKPAKPRSRSRKKTS